MGFNPQRSSEVFVTYEKIVLDKFLFIQHEFSEDFQKKIWALPYQDSGQNDQEIRFKISNVNFEIQNLILQEIKEIPLENLVWDFVSKFDFDINKMQKGESVPFHNEAGQKSPIELIIWLTKTNQFEGRDFVIKYPDKKINIKPTNGLICFLDTTPLDIFHGVTELLTDTEIISITGGLGRKLAPHIVVT